MSMFISAGRGTGNPDAVPVGGTDPAVTQLDAYAVTPSDGADLPFGIVNGITRQTRFIEVTGAGNVSVNLFGGGTAVFTGLAAGQRIRVGATRILATGTTATGIVALY